MTTTPGRSGRCGPTSRSELEEIIARTMVRDRNARTITAAQVRDLASSCPARLSSGASPVRPLVGSRRALVAAAVVTLVAVGGAVAWWAQRNANVRWAREQALPEIIRLAGTDQVRRGLPPRVAGRGLYSRRPAARRAASRGLARSDDRIGAVGRGGVLPSVRAPRRCLETARADADQGRPRSARTACTGRRSSPDSTWPKMSARDPSGRRASASFSCPAGTAPAGMVRVASSDQPFQIFHSGTRSLAAGQPAGLLDRSARGHQPRLQALRRRRRLPPCGALAGAVREGWQADRGSRRRWRCSSTPPDGRGRRTWEQGAYPAGQDDYPVTGVSWHEAAAFARWAGKSLPTIYHWSRAADQRLSGDVVPASNFGGKELLPVGRAGGVNAPARPTWRATSKEWCWNCRWREALHPRRRVERARLYVHGCRRAVAVRAPADLRLPVHQERTVLRTRMPD